MRRVAAKILKVGVAALAVVIVVVAAGAAFISSHYFAAALQAELTKTVLDTKHRTLHFDSPLEISFWPSAGFKMGRVSLSERDSAASFASIDAARFSVQTLPLLHGRVIVDACEVDGLKLAVVKRRDGTLNVDDLFGDQKSSGAGLPFDVAQARATHAQLSWTDEAAGTTTVANLDLAVDGLRGDPVAKAFDASRIAVDGAVAGNRARFVLTELRATGLAATVERMAMSLDAKSGDAGVEAALTARLVIDGERGAVALEDIASDFNIAHPRLATGHLKLPLRGSLHAGRNGADGDLATHFDESKAAVKFKVARFSPLALRFDIDIDRFDAGRYLAPTHDTPPSPAQASATDLSALDGIEIEGTAKIGSLRIAGVDAGNLRLDIRGSDGKLDVRSKRATAKGK